MLNKDLSTKLAKGLLVAGCVVTLAACGGGFGQDYDSPFEEPTPTPEPTPGPEPTPVPAPVDNNILSNSEFEEGDGDEFTGWTKLNAPDSLTAVMTDTCSGRGLQAVAAGQDYYNVQIETPAFATTASQNYTASMWIKGDVDGGVVRISTGGDSAVYGGDNTIGTDWQQVVFNFTGVGGDMNLRLDLGKSVASYIVDDVKVVPGDTPDPATCPHGSDNGNGGGDGGGGSVNNLATNGDLEASDTDITPWAVVGDGNATATLDTSVTHGGNNSLLVANRTANWNGASYDLLSVVDSNTTYNVTAQVRLASDTPDEVKISSKLVLNADEAGATYGGVDGASATVADSDWTELSGTFTTGDMSEATTFYIYFEGATASSSYYIDDLVVTESE
ncbi:carbohydrate binding domain-containing protein [Teredinibacter turnerae]|uniref:carbohydrate binding domain-containing protein n=1 Tax=Teredinibacter turnerae TaxID=2426 RepID=UPI0005F7B57B|nr:carbohydrate binding domain-containing protein [Teredinibacter turnerae]